MNTFTRIALVAVAVAPIPCQIASADLRHLIVETPKQCPEGLTIETSANKGMIDFDVSVDADEVAHAGELYKGRVRAKAHLSIATTEQQIAFVTLHGATEGKRTRYQFRISPSAAKTSELQLGMNLYEKDGHPTLGGGVSMQITTYCSPPYGHFIMISKEGGIETHVGRTKIEIQESERQQGGIKNG